MSIISYFQRSFIIRIGLSKRKNNINFLTHTKKSKNLLLVVKIIMYNIIVYYNPFLLIKVIT